MKPPTIAEEIVNKVLDKYRSCARFSCRAKLIRKIAAEANVTSRMAMRLDFSRPHNWFIEWFPNAEADSKITLIGTKHVAIRYSQPHSEWEAGASFAALLDSDAGVSAGLTLYLPNLITGNAIQLFEGGLEDMVKSEKEFAISGHSINGLKRIVTVRSDTFAIVKIVDSYNINSGSVQTIADFENLTFEN